MVAAGPSFAVGAFDHSSSGAAASFAAASFAACGFVRSSAAAAAPACLRTGSAAGPAWGLLEARPDALGLARPWSFVARGTRLLACPLGFAPCAVGRPQYNSDMH